jgi:urate oxidase
MTLGANSWGKSSVRVSKIHREGDVDDFSDLTVDVRLEGEVEAAHTRGDNTRVLPTDTMRNTVYAMAHDHLTRDLEGFGAVLCDRFLAAEGVTRAEVAIRGQQWARHGPHGFVGGSSEVRRAVVARGSRPFDGAGVEGLVVLKTTGSSFVGFPRDQFTALPEAEDRILATSVTADWAYSSLPGDTTAAWVAAREALVRSFFGEWSGSVQHQGYLMGREAIDAVPEMSEITLRLPNQHHLPFDVARFGVDDTGLVFHPVSEPYGDIRLTVVRDG